MNKFLPLLITALLCLNGRAQWLNNTFPYSGITQINDVIVLSESEVLVCGSFFTTGATFYPRILKSENSGASFVDVTPPAMAALHGAISQIQRLNDKVYFTGYANEETYFGVSDSNAQVWEMRKLDVFPGHILPISFVSATCYRITSNKIPLLLNAASNKRPF